MTQSPEPSVPGTSRVWLRTTLRWIAVGYPIALLILLAAFRFVGERWWVTTVGLYLPRLPFALPLVPLIAAILWVGPRRLLWTQLVAVALLLVLLGLRVTWPPSSTPGGFHLRVLTCNINSGSFGLPLILESLRAAHPDVILLQEVDPKDYDQLRAGVPGYSIHESGQFWMATRFPIEEVAEPPTMTQMGFTRSFKFVRYRVTTPAGPLTIYNIHPISPRDGLREVRGNGFRQQILRGDLFNLRARTVVAENTKLRLAQVERLAADARQAQGWVVMAGDTNLPDLSWAFGRWLGDFRDGFAEAGSGFGYTFPSPGFPWMRIDRIMAGQHLRFLTFRTLLDPISDHRALVADLEMPAPLAQAR